MIVNVVPDADLPYALVEEIRSDRALGILLRAVRSWYAFGHYDHAIIDLTSFNDWSSSIEDQLASAVTTAGDAGHWLAFFPGDTRWMRGADLDQIHVYPDRSRALLAMRENALSRQQRRWRRTQRLAKIVRRALSSTTKAGSGMGAQLVLRKRGGLLLGRYQRRLAPPRSADGHDAEDLDRRVWSAVLTGRMM